MIKAYMRIGRFEVQHDEDLLAQIPAVLEKACTVFSEQHRGSPEAYSFLDLANTMFVHAVSFFLFVMLAALPLQHIHLIMRIVIHHVSPYNEDRICQSFSEHILWHFKQITISFTCTEGH